MIGFKARNTEKILVIDSSYQNLQMVAKGTLTTSKLDSGIGYYADVVVPSGRASAVLAIRWNGTAGEYPQPSGVYWKKLDATTFRVYAGSPSVQATFDYFLFCTPIQTTEGGVIGLRIRNSSGGGVVYDSRYKYLRVLDYINETLVVDGVFSKAYPGKKVALIQTLRANYTRIDSGGTVDHPIFVITLKSSCMATPTDDAVRIYYRSTDLYTGFGSITPAIAGVNYAGYLVVDVTGY
ncbi:TPA: hypothetical protein ACQTX9_000110 [Pseudomonas aeruginosa]